MPGGAASDRTDRLAAGLLFLTMLYVLIGLPEADRHVVRPTDYVDPLNRWIWLGLLALALPILRRRRAIVLAMLRESWPLLVLYGWFALSATWALDPAASSRRLVESLVHFTLMLLLVAGVRDHARLHRAIARACLVTAAAELLVAVAAPGYSFDPDGFAGLHPQKNFAGEIMLYCILACGSSAMLARERRTRRGLGVAVVVMFLLLLLTRSATSTDAVLATPAVTWLLFRLARLAGATRLAMVLFMVLLLAAALFGYFAWCGHAGADPWAPLRDVTFTARRDLWEFMLDEIRQRPLTGYGFASFWSIDAAVQPSLKVGAWFGSDDVVINEGHNGYLDLLVTTGCVGLALGLVVVGRALLLAGRAVARHGRMARGTAAFHMVFLLAFLLHNFTESDLFAIGLPMGFGFLICLLDLQRWAARRRLDHAAAA
jgi:O-antigen ligase